MNTPRNFRTVLLVFAAALTIGILSSATAVADPPDPCRACAGAHQHQ
jgi:hypothetical protein